MKYCSIKVILGNLEKLKVSKDQKNDIIFAEVRKETEPITVKLKAETLTQLIPPTDNQKQGKAPNRQHNSRAPGNKNG